MNRSTLVVSAVGIAAALCAVGGVTANAEQSPGSDPTWVVANYLDNRLYGAAVADYPFVCSADREWSPAGVATTDGPPFAAEQDTVLDIRTYEPESLQVVPARNAEYRIVSVAVAGYERAETRNFLLAPQDGGYCIGEVT